MCDDRDEFEARPTRRMQCKGGQRPCPFVSCRHHLYLEVMPNGSIHLNFPGKEVWELKHTCSLDVADAGGATLLEAGRNLGITRERTRQIQGKALARIAKSKKRLTLLLDEAA